MKKAVSHWVLWGIVAILTISITTELRRDLVIVDLIEISPRAEARGYTQRIATDRLLDHVEEITLNAGTKSHRSNYAGVHDSEQPDFEIPKSGVTVRSLARYVVELFRPSPPRVSADLVLDSLDSFLTVRVTGTPPQRIPIAGTNVDSALAEAARYVVRATDPYVLAAYLDVIGDTAGARKQAVDMLQRPPYDDDAMAYNMLGMVALERGDTASGIAKLKLALRLDSSRPNANITLASVYVDNHRYAEAITLYRKAARMDRAYRGAALNGWGQALVGLGRIDEAAEKFEGSIQADPTDGAAYANLGKVLAARGKYADAFVRFEQALERNPVVPGVQLLWGYALLDKGDTAAAISKFRSEVASHPRYVEGYLALADALFDSGLADEAQQQYKAAIALDGRIDYRDAQVFTRWGSTLAKWKFYREAEALFAAALKLAPHHSLTFVARGISYYDQKRYADAVAQFDLAIRYEPSNTEAHGWRKRALRERRR